MIAGMEGGVARFRRRRGRIAAGLAAAAVLLTATGLIAGTPAAARTAPLMIDPGFESGSWAGTQHYRAAWVKPGHDGTGEAVRIGMIFKGDTRWPVDGNLPAEGWATHGYVSKPVTAVKPNTRYTITGWGKGDVEIGLWQNESTLYYNADRASFEVHSTDWRQGSATIVTGPRTTELLAFCLASWNPTSIGYCDDFSVSEAGPADRPQPPPKQWSEPPVSRTGFPVTIPAVQRFTATTGADAWKKRARIRFIVQPNNKRLLADAELLARQLRDAGLVNSSAALTGQPRGPGDILYTLGDPGLPADAPAGALRSESYSIKIAKERVTITAGGERGAFYAGQTLLQALRSQDWLPAGTVRDWTDQPVRGVQLDSARKWYSVGYVTSLIKDLSYTKINVLQLSIKDGQGIRMESKVAPELVDKNPDSGFWTDSDVRLIVAEAAKYHVEIVPVVNLPGHADADAYVYPQYAVKNCWANAWDYSQPKARALLTKIAREVAQSFGAKRMHLGGDEFGCSWDPALLAYAQSVGGPDATFQDGYRALFNEVTRGLADVGVENVWIWNDTVGGPVGKVSLEKSISIHYWISSPQPSLDLGYSTVSSPTSIYYVPWPWGSNRPTVDSLWGGFTTPYSYAIEPQAERPAGYLGQVFPFWGDHMAWPPAYALEQGLTPRIRLFAQTMWNSPRPVDSLAAFDPYLRFLGHPPGYSVSIEER